MAHTAAGGESVSASAVADSHSRSHSASSSARPSPTGSPHMHPVAVASLLRTLQKPFRMQQLLKDLLQLLGEEVAADGRSTTSNGLITAAAGSMLSVAADGTLDAARKSASPGGVRSHRRMVMSSGGGIPAPSVFEGSGRNSSILPPVPSGRTKLVPIAQDYPLRILLAEDNLINQKMMVMLLRKLGYEISVACNGREALDLLENKARQGRAQEISCILMDASMDVMDGLECTRVIRAQQLPHRMRPFIIAQTANVTEEFRQGCLQAGMDVFTIKPVVVEELTRVLKLASQHQEQELARLAAAVAGAEDAKQ